jgi:5-methylthioadenosine/S-adenosylhomocysteine deaminase
MQGARGRDHHRSGPGDLSNKGARRLYRGNIRNVEETDGPDLHGAGTRIGDVDATDAVRFLKTIKSKRCYILHLSEGTDQAARDHFPGAQDA